MGTLSRSSRVGLAAVAALVVLLTTTLALLLTPAHAQSKLSSTRPMCSYAFDTDPDHTIINGRSQKSGSSFTWSLGAGSHTGILVLDGVVDYVDLKYFPDDENGVNFTNLLWGEEISVEVWGSWMN